MTWSAIASTKLGATSSQYDPTTSAINTTGADLIVVLTQSSTTATLSDSKSNTWSDLTERSGATKFRLHWCVPSSVGSGHTFTCTTGTAGSSLMVLAFSGANATQGTVQENGSGYVGSSDTSMACGSVTPVENGDLLIAGVTASAGTSFSTPASFTAHPDGYIDTNGGTGVIGVAMAYYVQPTAGAINPTWNWTTGSYAATADAVFKISSGGGGGGVTLTQLERGIRGLKRGLR